MNSVITPNSATDKHAGKYLTVLLHGESYGLGVLKVREIIRLQKITPVPHLPGSVKGVINLRGRVIPIVDLRLEFGLPAETTDTACIVVVQVHHSDVKTIQVGLIVDAVEDVVNIPAAEIEPTPDFGAQIATVQVLGVAKVKGQVKILLDVDRVVTADALSLAAPTV